MNISCAGVTKLGTASGCGLRSAKQNNHFLQSTPELCCQVTCLVWVDFSIHELPGCFSTLLLLSQALTLRRGQGTPLCCPRHKGNISAALLTGILDNHQTINSQLKGKISITQCKFRNIYLFSWHEGVWLTSSIFIKGYPGKMEVLAYLFCSQVFSPGLISKELNSINF